LQVLLDRVGLVAVEGGGFAPGYDPDLEPYLDSGWPPVLIHIIADNAGAFIIWRPFLRVFPLASGRVFVFSGHFRG